MYRLRVSCDALRGTCLSGRRAGTTNNQNCCLFFPFSGRAHHRTRLELGLCLARFHRFSCELGVTRRLCQALAGCQLVYFTTIPQRSFPIHALLLKLRGSRLITGKSLLLPCCPVSREVQHGSCLNCDCGRLPGYKIFRF
jgi:hypothetical protein